MKIIVRLETDGKIYEKSHQVNNQLLEIMDKADDFEEISDMMEKVVGEIFEQFMTDQFDD